MIAAGFGLAASMVGLFGVGRLVAGREGMPDVALIAGWGAFCLLMTAWAVLTPWSLDWPLIGFGVVALAGLRHGAPGWRVLLLALPLLLAVLASRPSQVDTWLNLLPNLAFLVDHGRLPADDGAPSWSFLPAAPYNTQFVGFAISRVAGGLVANALSLFNAVLLAAAGLQLARACQPGARRPDWWACAAGLLLAIPLNPGFVPRVFLASYGEAPIAVALLMAVSLGAELFAAVRAGQVAWRGWVGLALVLCALVEIKQSALGLVLPFSATLLVLGLAAPGVRRGRWAISVGAASLPAVALYLLYRWYVLGHFAVGELKMLPVGEWHFALLPQILGGIAFAIFEKATYFLAVIAVLAAGVVEARRRPWGRAAILLGLAAGLIAGFNLFLLFTYVAHFPAVWAIHAHSYFRYMSQLSLVVMLALAVWLQPVLAAWVGRRSGVVQRRFGVTTVCCVLLLPVADYGMLRFDLDAPQPFLWQIAQRTAVILPQDVRRLALVLPGDGDDAVGSLLRGVLLFTSPRRAPMEFRTATLDEARAAGFAYALVSCGADGAAGLLKLQDGAWRVQEAWPVPASLRTSRFSAMLPRAALCLK